MRRRWFFPLYFARKRHKIQACGRKHRSGIPQIHLLRFVREAMKERAMHCLKIAGVLLAAGLAYGIFVMATGWAVPCIFRKVTGLLCPGCGISRMCLALMRLDFRAAFHYHPLVMLLAPFWLFAFLSWLIPYIREGKREQTRVQSWILGVSIVLLVLFGIIRNIV